VCLASLVSGGLDVGGGAGTESRHAVPGDGYRRPGESVIPATCLGLTPPKSIRPDILANRDRITVTGDAITFEAWGDGSRVTLSRQEGDLLLVLPGFAYPGRHVSRRITQLGTGRAINVSWFLRKRAIRRAWDRSGWRPMQRRPGP
jgi:hypothetical protein